MEKAEKALEHLRTIEGTAKSHELQAAATTLVRYLAALGSRPGYAKHYANLLYAALPTLLSLASNESAEIRLVGDEALNRTVVVGFSFHAYKTNVLLQNQIDVTKNARWFRAALSRICLGDCWLRPGVGKIVGQTQTLFPKLSQIVRQTNDVQLTVETLENNLPRILKALGEYVTDEEISDLSKALLSHIESSEPVIRRGVASCIAQLCSHREPLLTNVLEQVYSKLWPLSNDAPVILGWFSVIKAIFQLNNLHTFADNELFSIQDYMELYTLCLHYIEQTTNEHNIQNTVIECLSVLLSNSKGQYRKALLEKHPRVVCLYHEREKKHRRNMSCSSAMSSKKAPSLVSEARDVTELRLSGALHLGSLVQLNTPSLSVEDLSIQTPDTPVSDSELHGINTEQLSKDLTEKLEEIEQAPPRDEDSSIDRPYSETGIKINIGSATDDDIPLKYCTRLLASKFLLSGNKNGVIPDRSVRVSVKASSLNCLSEILKLYPQVITLYLDKDADLKSHNVSEFDILVRCRNTKFPKLINVNKLSTLDNLKNHTHSFDEIFVNKGSTENTDSNEDNINDFILERNICYQDSLTESLCQELFHRSVDTQSLSKKDSKSTDNDKSMESIEQKSSKDIQSNILDSRIYKNELLASAISAGSTNIMTNSNFTSNSNMTGSIDRNSTVYPMSTSGDVLSSSIDLDIKFDHFGESTSKIDNLSEKGKKVLQRADEVTSKDVPDSIEKRIDTEKIDIDFEFQHVSDVFTLFENHNDPQIRGLIRVCIGNYLCAVLDLSHGDYSKWKNLCHTPSYVIDNIAIDKLVGIVLKGLSDEIHSSVNHALSALVNLFSSLCNSEQSSLLTAMLNSLIDVETNKYWLCRVSLCNLYEKIPYQRLFTLLPDYRVRSKNIMETLIRLLGDQDQRVRKAAAQAITSITPVIFPSKRETPATMHTKIARKHSDNFVFDHKVPSLDLVRNMYFYNDLPEQLKTGAVLEDSGSLKMMVADLLWRLMSSNCKYFSQGLLEALQSLTHEYLPYKHVAAYTELGLLKFCIECVDTTSCSVVTKTVMLDLCCRIYPVEMHNIMKHRKSNRDIFERDSPAEKWQHLDSQNVAAQSEKFLQVTLKMLNLLVHLIEEVNPNVHLHKGGIALPGSPVRKKSQENQQRKSTSDSQDQGTLRKKASTPANSLRANFSGHFYNQPLYMKLYENLRAAYSNHKLNLDPKSSMFYEFLSTVLNCLAIQLEFSTVREFGPVTEEILYYLKIIMPLRPDLSVFCITQLLKTLFGTNMITQYIDFMSIADDESSCNNSSFFDDVLMINTMKHPDESDDYSRKMEREKQLLIAMENFNKNKMDKKWSTNKSELERYIRLFEPVVIQALKSYTMQNDIPLQCKVLSLLNQLLTLRVNYCLLDSDQVFIGFLLKQLDLVEQHEIPDCCELISSILMFLVQLSSSKHHTKQIIEIPKLIQVCDGLMASGAQAECVAGIEPVAAVVFSNMWGANLLGKARQQEVQATREVLFYMLQKTMHQPRVLDLVSCVLCLTKDQSENYMLWCELATDTLLNLLSKTSVEIDSFESIKSLERLIDCIHRDVILDQSRVEFMLKILFKTPPEQSTTPYKLKLRYLSTIMILLRKLLSHLPENDLLLSIDYLKATHVSPSSIFFNIKPDIDPLNVQNVNENCANLPSDVILVRFLFKTLTYSVLELDNCNETECGNLDLKEGDVKGENHRLLYAVSVNLLVLVKNMTDHTLFPQTCKSAQTLLHNEQSHLNTGMYSPDENIPLDVINLICIRSAARMPLLTVHCKHIMIRLNFLTHKYWQRLIGFVSRSPLVDSNCKQNSGLLHTACAFIYSEYFTLNGITNVVHLSWLLVNRIHVLVAHYNEPVIRSLIDTVQGNATASGLLLQAIAARCQHCLKDEFAVNTYKMLSQCHESQSGALVFLICRIVGKLEPAVAVGFINLAIERCQLLKEMSFDQITVQLSKEDVQVALELLQRDKVHIRYPSLILELNCLASTVFDLSPLDLSQDRSINPQYISTTNIDHSWIVNLAKNRCCQSECSQTKIPKYHYLALLLSNLSKDDLSTVMSCSEFDRRILSSTFKVSCDNFSREFLNAQSIFESKELERESMRDRIAANSEMTSSIDSNKMNISNTIHVFKKSDNKESKSQFFIPMTDVNETKDRFGNLQLADEEPEFLMPAIPDLYKTSLSTFDSSLTDVIRLFPKQSRPLSQSENFDLSTEHTIDRYTRRCHQVFQDKLFYQEFITIQTVMTGFLDSLQRILVIIDEFDCELLDSRMDTILPTSVAKNMAIFCVISLQYLSFLIKNKKLVESPVHADVSFRVTATVTDDIVVDNVVLLTVENVAKALCVREIWSELNSDSNLNRMQSAISCLYAIVKYLVKDTKPLILKQYLPKDSGPKSDVHIIGDKLVTLVEFWENQLYGDVISNVIDQCYRTPIENLIIALSRLDVISNIALIPPLAWSSVEIGKKDDWRIDLPLNALQDMDVLEAFLFRVNLIGWSSKKQFEEIWVALLGALQGNGTHWAVRGITALLISALPTTRKGILHVPRSRLHVTNGHQLLRNILVGTKSISLFDDTNLERIPLASDGYNGYHYSQFSIEYLQLAGDTMDIKASAYTKRQVKRVKRNDVDVNSCLQLLMDIASDMLSSKSEAGLSSRAALHRCIGHITAVLCSPAHWVWACGELSAGGRGGAGGAAGGAGGAAGGAAGAALLYGAALCTQPLREYLHTQELSSVPQCVAQSLSSSKAALRQAALHACLLLLQDERCARELLQHVHSKLRSNIAQRDRISLYEQSLNWTLLFALIELGHPDLMNLAVQFLLENPYHYCTDLVVRGITSVLRQQVLPKDLKNATIEKLLDNMHSYTEHHAVQILMVHLFSADTKLLSPKPTTVASNMDPDILMNAMERITLLYKILRQCAHRESRYIVSETLKYFLRETLPPTATLSRVVIEFVESCKAGERETEDVASERQRCVECSVINAEIVFEVFETSVHQDQLPVLSGWIFEALCHLLNGKISAELLPFCLLTLLVCATPNKHLRLTNPLVFYILKTGFYKNVKINENWGVFREFILANEKCISFNDKRLLCLVAIKSNFAGSQMERLKELCVDNDSLKDLMACLCN